MGAGGVSGECGRLYVGLGRRGGSRAAPYPAEAETQDVGRVLPQECQAGGEGTGQQDVVGIDKEQVLAPGLPHAVVARAAGGPAGIVGDDDFVFFFRHPLSAYGVEGALQQGRVCLAVEGDDYADEWIHTANIHEIGQNGYRDRGKKEGGAFRGGVSGERGRFSGRKRKVFRRKGEGIRHAK